MFSRGVSFSNATAYYGIRYATAAPWDMPVLVPFRNDASGLQYPGPDCMQCKAKPSCFAAGILNGLTAVRDADTCLTLNVIAPSKSVNNPVVVMLHGGGGTSGSANSFFYDMVDFVEEYGILTVIPNYRLGPYSMWHHTSVVSSSLGTEDQVLALRWVNMFIRMFGGDETRVTLVGFSSGGASVLAMLQHPIGASLFHSYFIGGTRFHDDTLVQNTVIDKFALCTSCPGDPRKCSTSEFDRCVSRPLRLWEPKTLPFANYSAFAKRKGGIVLNDNDYGSIMRVLMTSVSISKSFGNLFGDERDYVERTYGSGESAMLEYLNEGLYKCPLLNAVRANDGAEGWYLRTKSALGAVLGYRNVHSSDLASLVYGKRNRFYLWPFVSWSGQKRFKESFVDIVHGRSNAKWRVFNSAGVFAQRTEVVEYDVGEDALSMKGGCSHWNEDRSARAFKLMQSLDK